jgi:hypothetical protein
LFFIFIGIFFAGVLRSGALNVTPLSVRFVPGVFVLRLKRAYRSIHRLSQ